MSMMPLVSIISPCYNGEKYLSCFLESVLSQSYDNIELIMVDDGSTDRTKEIICSFEDKFRNRNLSLCYIYQENRGQAAAINRGLKLFSGEYLMWTDSDDILYPENVEKKVLFLEENPCYGYVQCLAEEVRSDALGVPNRMMGRNKPEGEDMLFEDLIYERNVCFCPGVIMVKRNAILSAIPSLQIFESREGQNWQLMLPLAHMHLCGYIDAILLKIVAHNDSHSRSTRSYQQLINRIEGFQELLTHTIRNLVDMDEATKQEWMEKITVKYQKKLLEVAIQNHDLKLFFKAKSALQKYGYACKKDIIYLAKVQIASNKVGHILYRLVKWIKQNIF